jgi:aquaporin Z
MLLRRLIGAPTMAAYWGAQVLAALLAFTFGYMLTGHATGIHPGGNVSWLSALAAELVFSVALVTVVLNVAATRATAGNSYYGIAIGFTVAAGAFAVGPISGAAFNPAVGIGATVAGVLFGHGSWSDVWLYVVGPLAGAAIAAGIHMLQTPARPVTPQSSERRQD